MRSKRVMGKLGPRFEMPTAVPATGQQVEVHAITRREFGDGLPYPDRAS